MTYLPTGLTQFNLLLSQGSLQVPYLAGQSAMNSMPSHKLTSDYLQNNESSFYAADFHKFSPLDRLRWIQAHNHTVYKAHQKDNEGAQFYLRANSSQSLADNNDTLVPIQFYTGEQEGLHNNAGHFDAMSAWMFSRFAMNDDSLDSDELSEFLNNNEYVASLKLMFSGDINSANDNKGFQIEEIQFSQKGEECETTKHHPRLTRLAYADHEGHKRIEVALTPDYKNGSIKLQQNGVEMLMSLQDGQLATEHYTLTLSAADFCKFVVDNHKFNGVVPSHTDTDRLMLHAAQLIFNEQFPEMDHTDLFTLNTAPHKLSDDDENIMTISQIKGVLDPNAKGKNPLHQFFQIDHILDPDTNEDRIKIKIERGLFQPALVPLRGAILALGESLQMSIGESPNTELARTGS